MIKVREAEFIKGGEEIQNKFPIVGILIGHHWTGDGLKQIIQSIQSIGHISFEFQKRANCSITITHFF